MHLPSKDEERRNLPNTSTRSWSLSPHYSPLPSLLAKFPVLYPQPLPSTADSTTSKHLAAHSVRLTLPLGYRCHVLAGVCDEAFHRRRSLAMRRQRARIFGRDISRVLSELKTPIILKGWDENKQPILEEAKRQISLFYYIFLPTMAIFCSVEDRPRMRC
jgi:hypothetical protein